MTELCCNDPLPVLSEDGLNTVNCANCGATYILYTEEYEKTLQTLLSLTAAAGADTTKLAATFKSLPNDPRAHQFAGFVLESCIRLLATELAEQAPETRNRMSVAIEFPDGEWTLTFARGQYHNAMEDQRNEARAERDALRLQVESLAALLVAQETK